MEADIEDINKYMNSLEPGKNTGAEEIKRLRKLRGGLLEDIHLKQQCLDGIDYLIREIKNSDKI